VTRLAEHRAVISGVGQSAIGRQVDRSGLQLTIDAILAAVADAGLDLDQIDGLAMFPGGGAANLPGYANGNIY
jgi:acetyl-CoA acetyltransferase